MTEILVAIGALIVAAVGGWLAHVQRARTQQAKAQAQRDRCYIKAQTSAREARNAIDRDHPDDPAARLADMAEYCLQPDTPDLDAEH